MFQVLVSHFTFSWKFVNEWLPGIQSRFYIGITLQIRHTIQNGSRASLSGPAWADWQKNGLKKSHDTVHSYSYNILIYLQLLLGRNSISMYKMCIANICKKSELCMSMPIDAWRLTLPMLSGGDQRCGRQCFQGGGTSQSQVC